MLHFLITRRFSLLLNHLFVLGFNCLQNSDFEKCNPFYCYFITIIVFFLQLLVFICRYPGLILVVYHLLLQVVTNTGLFKLKFNTQLAANYKMQSMTICRGSWVVGGCRGSWVWIKVVGKKIK